MNLNNNQEAFMALVRAGLWEKEVRLSPSDVIDFREVLQIAEEQSVVGLVAAGIEHIEGFRVPQADVLAIAGRALQIEQRNTEMNAFIEDLIEKLRQKDISVLLLKGQGLAQCYERPLWRVCGDVDLLVGKENYEKAQKFFQQIASSSESEDSYLKHNAFTIDNWLVELHGNSRTGLSYRIDKCLDQIQEGCYLNKEIQTIQLGGTKRILPAQDNNLIFIFTHILKHFFKGGVGVRQICDWCRLLWTYRNDTNHDLLKKRLKRHEANKRMESLCNVRGKVFGFP